MLTLKWPPEFDGRGALRTVDDPAAVTQQLVVLYLTPGQSANPWDVVNEVGYPDPLYEVEGGKAGWRSFVTKRFARLERFGVAKLTRVDVGETTEAGTADVDIVYHDLRARQERVLTLEA